MDLKRLVFTFMAMTLCAFVLSSCPYPQETANGSAVMTQTDTSTAQTHAENLSFLDKLDELWDTQTLDFINIAIAFIALVIAIKSLRVACKSLNIATQSLRYDKAGYEETKRTADNVTRASFNVQKGQFDDLIRHLYRNLVCTLAFTQRIMENRDPEQMKESKPFPEKSDHKDKKGKQGSPKSSNRQQRQRKGKYFSAYRQAENQDVNQSQPELKETEPQEKKYQYPSEEHLLKLKVLPEDVLHLESYNQDDKIYQKMHELKLLLRNYDIEIDTAMTHLKENAQDETMIKENLDTLTFKPLFLISKIVGVVKSLDKKESMEIDEYQNAASIMTRSHVGNLIEHKESFRINEYLDLNLQLPLEKTGRADVDKEATRVKKPYNGFGRAYNLFFKEVINANKKAKPDEGHADKTAKNEDEDSIKDYVTHSERFEDKKPDDYKDAIVGICGKDEVKPNDKESTKKLKNFRKSITTKEEDKETKGNFPFKKHFLTMLSIDVTIELSKIHMIDINKPA